MVNDQQLCLYLSRNDPQGWLGSWLGRGTPVSETRFAVSGQLCVQVATTECMYLTAGYNNEPLSSGTEDAQSGEGSVAQVWFATTARSMLSPTFIGAGSASRTGVSSCHCVGLRT